MGCPLASLFTSGVFKDLGVFSTLPGGTSSYLKRGILLIQTPVKQPAGCSLSPCLRSDSQETDSEMEIVGRICTGVILGSML